MKLSLFIAKRYLFSKKKQNAINIISVISVVGVAIGTSALVIILSVFNGIDLLLQKSADSFTPDLVISPLTGKFSHFDDSLYQVLRNNSSVAYYNQIVEEKALVKYDDKLSPVTIKGVADDYARNTHFEDNIIQGTFQLKTGDTYKSVVGYGLAAELGIGLNFLTPMVFYYPDKNAGVSASALNTAYLYPSAFFSSQQEIEGQYVLTDLEKKFISYFDECLSAKTPKQFKVLSKKMCEFLSKNGYSVDVELYTSPKKAMPVAMELDMCLPKGTIGIGAVLFDFVIGVENYLKENN